MKVRASRNASLLLSNCYNSRLKVCSDCLQTSRATYSTPLTANFFHFARRRQSSWAQAVSVGGLATSILSDATTQAANSGGIVVDPLRTIAKEMKFLRGNIQQQLGSGNPSLHTVAKYYTQSEGKHVRPALVLLMSRATSLTPRLRTNTMSPSSVNIDVPISPSNVLLDANPSLPSTSKLAATSSPIDSDILRSQLRLAEITETIHIASLLHDDVIDQSTTRRSSPSANVAFGNKMAVLGGDFLLARASVALARLQNPEVVELLATVIANLVEGEIMQLQNTSTDEKNPVFGADNMEYYLKKTYLKSASLISKSCRAAALLGGCEIGIVDAAYYYGKNLGLAFQLVDDMLDYTISDQELGKPAGADLELGLATAPLLFAWKQNEELGALVGRKFQGEGDVARARELVLQSDGLQQTRALAQDYVDQAIAAIKFFPTSEAKHGLEEMALKTLSRRK